MKVYSEQMVCSAMDKVHVTDLAKATIGQMLQVANRMEQDTKIPFIHLEQGDPGLPANFFGIEAEIEALRRGVPGKYPDSNGLPELKEAASRFIEAFLDVKIAPECCIPVSGTVGGSFMTLLLCSQLDPSKDKVLFLDPCFPLQQSQLRLLGIPWREFDIYDYRGDKLRDRLEEEFKKGDITVLAFNNPNNPAWICLDEKELQIIGELATEYGVIVLEDQAYFCMDFRKDLSHPFEAPFAPTVAKYTDSYIIMTSASKIFSYAGQRVGVVCISPALYHKVYPTLKSRYGGSGKYGPTFVDYVVEMITCGTTLSAQYAYAKMLQMSCDGDIKFVYDMQEYGRRASIMKKIFTDHGFHLVYSMDEDQPIGDGFFFTIGYKDMTGAEMLKELMYYGISCVNLISSGSKENGLRICTSNIKKSEYSILEERVSAFDKDHQLR